RVVIRPPADRTEACAGRIEDIRWSGQGCSLSQASASMLTERLVDSAVQTFGVAVEQLRAILRGERATVTEESVLGDAIALSGAARFPARVRCVMLAWTTLETALETALDGSSR